MKVLFAAALVAGTLVGLSGASAAGGCGPGWHRGPYGGCRPNGVVVVPGAVVVERPVVVVARPPRLPDRLYVALWTLPSDLIAVAFSRYENPARNGGVF